MRLTPVIIATAFATLVALVASALASAVSAERVQPTRAAGVEQTLPQPGKTSAAAWRRLERKARVKGTIRVILALDVETRAEGVLSAADRADQRQAIAAARARVLEELAGSRKGKVVSFDDIPYVLLEASAGALGALEDSPDVLAVSQDEELSLGAPQGTSSNRPSSPWWHHYRMNVDDSWANGYRGTGQTVAIIDTGVDSTHPYLSGRVVREACFSSANETSSTGYCGGAWSRTGTGSAAPCVWSGCAHGTHVAGIAAGSYGVASSAGIFAVQVFHPQSSGCAAWETAPCARTSWWDVLRALNHVYSFRSQYRIAAVNMSIGGNPNYSGYCDSVNTYASGMAAAIANLRSYQIATVVSSGNDNDSSGISMPACLSNTVPVGNSTLDTAGRDAVFGNAWTGNGYTGSNASPNLWLLAPGTQICSAIPARFSSLRNVACDSTGVGGYMSGTSMAAPQVAGAFAALKQLRPTATVGSSLNALWYTGTFVTDSRRADNLSRPRIDVWQALGYLYNH